MTFRYTGVLSGDEIKLTYISETGGGRGPGGMGGGRGSDGMSDRDQDSPKVAKTLVIEQTENTIKITGKEVYEGQDLVETFRLDRKDKAAIVDLPDGSKARQITNAKLNKTKLTISVETNNEAGASSTQKREFVLSKDGKILTLNITTEERRGSRSQKLVYNKE